MFPNFIFKWRLVLHHTILCPFQHSSTFWKYTWNNFTHWFFSILWIYAVSELPKKNPALMWEKKEPNNDFSCSTCFPWDRKFHSKHTLKLVGHPLISVEQIYKEILKNRRKKLVTTNWRNSFLNNALQIYTMITQSCLWCTTPQSFNFATTGKAELGSQTRQAPTTSILRHTRIN